MHFFVLFPSPSQVGMAYADLPHFRPTSPHPGVCWIRRDQCWWAASVGSEKKMRKSFRAKPKELVPHHSWGKKTSNYCANVLFIIYIYTCIYLCIYIYIYIYLCVYWRGDIVIDLDY
jgi:hypothetical protein